MKVPATIAIVHAIRVTEDQQGANDFTVPGNFPRPV
jgi:hypothetical protein